MAMTQDQNTCVDGSMRKECIGADAKDHRASRPCTHSGFIPASLVESIVQAELLQYTAATAEYQLEDIKLIGHRGNGQHSRENQVPRENTIESFLLAYGKGAQMVEMDVQLTSDKQLVIFHNHAINNKLVAGMTYREFLLETHSMENDIHSTNTTLENVLEALPKDLALYLEIKHEPHVKSYPPNYAREVVKHTLELVGKYPAKRILFASFFPYVCALLKTWCPSYKVCFLMGDSTLHHVSRERLTDTVERFVEDFMMDGIVCDTVFYAEAEELFSRMKGKAKILYGRGANDPESIARFADLGFTGFCTDNLDIYTAPGVNL